MYHKLKQHLDALSELLDKHKDAIDKATYDHEDSKEDGDLSDRAPEKDLAAGALADSGEGDGDEPDADDGYDDGTGDDGGEGGGDEHQSPLHRSIGIKPKRLIRKGMF